MAAVDFRSQQQQQDLADALVTSSTSGARSSIGSDDEALAAMATSSGNSSPRRSWEESFQNLSRDLKVICGSNGSVDEMTSSGGGGGGECNGAVDANVLQPVNTVRYYQPISVVSSASVVTCLVVQNTVSRSVPHNRVQQRKAGYNAASPQCLSPVMMTLGARNSFPFPPTVASPAVAVAGRLPGAACVTPTRPGWRPVRVQHEETTDRLRVSLTKICLQNSGSSNNSSGSPSPSSSNSGALNQVSTAADRPNASVQRGCSATKSTQLRMKESLKSGVRVRLDLAAVGCDPDYVVVAIRSLDNVDDQVLTVWNAAAVDSSAPLHCVTLPKQTRVAALACYVTDANVLYIREKSKDAMHVESDSAENELFIPVIREDEAQLTVTITLHVGERFRFEELSVRTIDDRLVVKGRRSGLMCMPEGPNGQRDAESDVVGSFTMMMVLPEGTYTRTVKAVHAPREHQLVVTAMRAPASRRMTCAF